MSKVDYEAQLTNTLKNETIKEIVRVDANEGVKIIFESGRRLTFAWTKEKEGARLFVEVRGEGELIISWTT